MDTIVLLARLLLALVFLVAGITKLLDRAGSQKALTEFGIPARLAVPLAILLPLSELAVSGALIAATTAWWGGVGALTLLLLFLAGIGINLAQGRKPDCHCFGQLHSAPLGIGTLVRNGLLTVVAVLIVMQGARYIGPNVLTWLGSLVASSGLALLAGILVTGVLCVQAWLLFHLLRQHGRLLLRIEALEARLSGTGASLPSTAKKRPFVGLPLGTPAPDFRLPGLMGEAFTLEALLSRKKSLLLIFVDHKCGPCLALLPDINRWQQEQAAMLTIALITRGTPEANRGKFAELGRVPVLLQQDREVAAAYKATGTPGAVLLGPDGTIQSEVAFGPEAIRELVARATGQQPKTLAVVKAGAVQTGTFNGAGLPVARIGDSAPALRLPDLTGNTVDLADFRGHPVFLLLWNPHCGFCKNMLEDLKAWEAQRSQEMPRLIVVSTGSVAENASQGFQSPVLLDNGTAGRAFGMNGTPSAILVDAEGRIASKAVAGAQAIFALIAPQPAPAPLLAPTGLPS